MTFSSKLPILKRSEVIVDKKLGSGGFCSVFSIRKFQLQSSLGKDDEEFDGAVVDEDTSATVTAVTTTAVTQKNTTHDNSSSTTTTIMARNMLQTQFQDYEQLYFAKIVLPGSNTVVTVQRTNQFQKSILTDLKHPKPPRVAIKQIKHSLTKNPTSLRYKTGLQDLISEIHILEQLHHPHIIGIYALGYDDDEMDHEDDEKDHKDDNSTTDKGIQGGTITSINNKNHVFQPSFCILDQLRSTLRNRMYKWKDDMGKATLQQMFQMKNDNPSRNVRNQIWLERLVVLLRIADAIKYMHQQGIVHRDINPDNIGFTDDNIVKIFDFGLAKRLVFGAKQGDDTKTSCPPTKEEHDDENDPMQDTLWQLTSKTGTLRYMSPEVGLSMPYGFKVDVYSLGIVIQEVLSLNKPFIHVNPSVFEDQVMKGGLRPSLDESWPIGIRKLISDMWSSDIGRRPSSSNVVKTLEMILRGKDEDLYPEYHNWTKKLGNKLESFAEDLKVVGSLYIHDSKAT